MVKKLYIEIISRISECFHVSTENVLILYVLSGRKESMGDEGESDSLSARALSTKEWVNWEMMHLDVFMFLVVGMGLVLSFIGLYVGSMLRRPGKSGK